MHTEITAGRAAMPDEPISQEAARAMLAALRDVIGFAEARLHSAECRKTHPDVLAALRKSVTDARAAIALAERAS